MENQNKIIYFNDYIKYTSMNYLRDFMKWEDYGIVESSLNEFAIDKIQNKAISLLCRNYGHFKVGVELINNTGDYPQFYFPEFEGDLMTYFPPLIQSLSITLKMLGINVPEIDILTETTDRTEDISSLQKGDNSSNSSTDIENTNSSFQDSTNDTTQTTNSSSKDSGTSENEIKYEREISNTSTVDETGNKNVGLTHNMPEQALNGTGNFSKDEQGTPILDSSYVQNATENFSTLNPISTVETSTQKDIENKQITTNDLLQENESLNDTFSKGKVESTSDSKGKTKSEDTQTSKIEGEGKNIIHDVKTTEKTNPQYAQEISKFLDNVQAFNAFENFIDKFSWLCGVI